MIYLQSIIDDVVVKANAESKRVPKASPSNLGKCLRQLMLMENGYPHTEFEARQLRVFRVGYLFEKFVEEALEKSGKLLDKQIYLDDFMGIRGSLDFLIRDDETKEVVIADCKSVHSGKFDYLDRGEVDKGYAMQQTMYFLALEEMIKKGNYKLPEGYTLSPIVWLFYVEKECLLTKQIAVDISKYDIMVCDKVQDIDNAREQFKKDKTLPAELDPIGTWECFTVQKTKHKVPRPIGVKVWCNYIENCPNVCQKKKEVEEEIIKNVDKS